MRAGVAIAVGALAGTALFAGGAKDKTERKKLLLPGALIGGGLGWWALRASGAPSGMRLGSHGVGRAFGRNLGALGETYGHVRNGRWGVINPAALVALINAGSSLASSGVQIASQVSAQKAIAKQQATQAKAAAQAARDAERVARMQALQSAAEARRLQAAGAASPLRSPAVVLSLVAAVGLVGILLLRKKPRPAESVARRAA